MAAPVPALSDMPRDQNLTVPAETATAGLGESAARNADLEAKLAQRAADTAHLDAELRRVRATASKLARELETSRRELQWMLASSSWRLTRPLRMLAAGSPKLTKYGRRLANSLWLGKAFPVRRHSAPDRVGEGVRAGLSDRDEIDRLVGIAHDRAGDCQRLERSGLLDERWYRTAAKLEPTVNAAEHYLTVGWREGIEPSPGFEGAFLQPYFSSAGFSGPPAITYLTLRDAGWPVYSTRTEAEESAGPIRASNLFDAAEYKTRAPQIGTLDPALHYVIVGERMGISPSEGFDPGYYGDRYGADVPGVGNRLYHFLTYGRVEGLRPLPAAATLKFDRTRLDPKLDTVLLVTHEASRTGAPILTYNLAKRLRSRFNVVAVLLDGGNLVADFEDTCAAVIGPLSEARWHDGEIKHLVKYLLAAYPISYAIVNSTESARAVPPLVRALVPTVLLAHEFATYVRPKSMMREGLEWATEIVFSAELVARSAREEYPVLTHRRTHVLPQGRCDLPPVRERIDRPSTPPNLARIFRPAGAEDAAVVMGCGTIHIRKGVDLFISCAAAVAAMRPRRPVRFVWIGHGYDPEGDTDYSCYLEDQIARSGLGKTVEIIDEITDLESAYAISDVFFLSSRLDPLPNVMIDATLRGLPVVCFAGTSGMADILGADAATRECVVPHLDVEAAARLIVELTSDEARRRRLGDALKNVGRASFDMDHYVGRLGELGKDAVAIMRQRGEDLATVRADTMFDPETYLPAGAARTSRSEAIVDFLARSAAIGTAPDPDDYGLRRPCPGFHPQVYAHAHAGSCDTAVVNPLAHFIRGGKPDGAWRHEVITPASPAAPPPDRATPPTALHAHFHYPELAQDFVQKLTANETRCDLLLSTDDNSKARALRNATASYRCGQVDVRVLPNRGRDIGAFLTAYAEEIASRYVIIGHLHGKRSPTVGGQADPTLGDRWREFLWQNLLGGSHPMMDTIIAHLAADETLGLVFPDDPHVCGWRANRNTAQALAVRMGMPGPLPPFFDFPIGTMFWARTAALKPLFDLKLAWENYPPEPLPYDGTLLHAIERLLPFVAQHAGYRFATTHVPGVTW